MICAKLIYEKNPIKIDLVACKRTKRRDNPRHILFIKFFILIFYFISIIQKLPYGMYMGKKIFSKDFLLFSSCRRGAFGGGGDP